MEFDLLVRYFASMTIFGIETEIDSSTYDLAANPEREPYISIINSAHHSHTLLKYLKTPS
jgi:hypothetical protein